MTEQLIRWTSHRFTRRSALRWGASSLFGIFAGLSVGSRTPAYAAPCTGPNGTGQCSASWCSGNFCSEDANVRCTTVTGFCPSGGACWGAGGGFSCCDCRCCSKPNPSNCWYCFCYGL